MKNVIITGASKGIGKAIAIAAAKKGYNLAICARGFADLEALTKELLLINDIDIVAYQADVSKEEDCKNFVEAAKSKLGHLDILVNNAGVFLPAALTDVDKKADFSIMMNTNLYSAYFMTQFVLPLMPSEPTSHIFNMCSIASVMPYSAYSVSKFALLGFSKVLREELKQRNIKVTAILPGATLTDSWAGSTLPQERFMTAEDVAAALWACYDLGAYTVVEEILLRPMLGDI
jgi:NAD(P)-dependent dehydrogenase (short-subunit alcohol dehydrogenase family)